MNLVTYYVETSDISGPAALFRRRRSPEPGVARADECFVPSDGTWRSSTRLRKYESPGDDLPDWDFYGVLPDETGTVMAWLREAAEVGRDKAGRPPVIGEWTVGRAWWVFVQGQLTEETAETVASRLGMARRAPVGPLERDLGLRVLRSDMEGRWNFELSSHGDASWVLHLEYLRLEPGKPVIDGLRGQVYPLVEQLGMEIAEERVHLTASFPHTVRAAKDKPPPPPPARSFVRYQASLDGGRFLAQFEKALGLVREHDVDDEEEDEYGERFLSNGRGGSMRLNTGRGAGGVEYLSLHCWDEPDPAVVDQLVRDVHAAAAQAGLVVKHEVHNPEDNS
jgi:hypothetical protein